MYITYTTEVILTGHAAIRFADKLKLTLNKFADPIEDRREGLTPEEALEIASVDPDLIFLLVGKRRRRYISDDDRLETLERAEDSSGPNGLFDALDTIPEDLPVFGCIL